MDQVLALSPDFDATQLTLTAAEGYLLSRIDGATPSRLLREMGGFPASEVDSCLTRWLEEGVLALVSDETRSVGSGASSSEKPDPKSDKVEFSTPDPWVIDESLLDDSLEIGLDAQRRVLEFEGALALPYHELLGVDKGDDPKVVKRAYFKLSKEFHPDRYFRREIGGYAKRLDGIFKKVLEAHEILSDPKLRQLENQAESQSGVAAKDSVSVECSANEDKAAGSSAVDESSVVEEPPAPKPLTKLERLRQRMPFKIDPAVIAQRRTKADEIFRAALSSQRNGRFSEAEASLRIAISFDPARTEFKEALGALRLESAGARAAKLLAAPSERLCDADLRESLALLEDVLIYRPHDPELNERAARVCLRLRKYEMAEEYAKTLIERCPENAEHHSLLGLIYRSHKNIDSAVREFERALKFDEDNLDARRALAAIRIGHHDAVQGGTS